MNKRVLSLALSSVFTLGLALAVPQDQAPPPGPPPQGGSPDAAGPGGPGGPGARRMMDPDRQAQMLSKRLKLSGDQTSQIKGILADSMSQMQALRGDTSMAQPDKMAKMRSMREDTDSKVKAVLNDDQKAQYDKIVAQRREQMRDRMQQRQGGAPPPDGTNQ